MSRYCLRSRVSGSDLTVPWASTPRLVLVSGSWRAFVLENGRAGCGVLVWCARIGRLRFPRRDERCTKTRQEVGVIVVASRIVLAWRPMLGIQSANQGQQNDQGWRKPRSEKSERVESFIIWPVECTRLMKLKTNGKLSAAAAGGLECRPYAQFLGRAQSIESRPAVMSVALDLKRLAVDPGHPSLTQYWRARDRDEEGRRISLDNHR